MSTHASAATKLKIVKAHEAGNSITHLSNIFKYHRNTISGWLKEFREKGKKAFIGGTIETRGRPSKICTSSEEELFEILKEPATEYGFENDLWTTKRIQNVCSSELGLRLSRMAIWRFLSRAEYSFKKVQKEYYEVDKDKQSEWKKKVIPKIKKLVKEKRAILYFEDESSIQLSPVMGKSWGPIGEKIKHKVTGNKGSLSAISAISSDGRLFFEVHDQGKRFNSSDIIAFLIKLLKEHKRRHLVVVMDRATCHTSKMVKKFIASQKRLHVFWLPPRSPEFNPDEGVWAHLKNHSLKSHKESNTKSLKKLSKKKLRQLAKNTEKVKGIFYSCENASLYV